MNAEQWFAERAHSFFKDVSEKTIPLHEPPTGIKVSKSNKFGTGNIYRNTKGGYVPALGLTVRSAWEKYFMLILKAYKIAFEYEQYVYNFPPGRGAQSYLPDLWLPKGKGGDLVEIKGFWSADSKQKFRKLKKYFPEDFAVLTVVTSKYNKAGLEFCAKISMPNILYWEDIEKRYKDMISDWH